MWELTKPELELYTDWIFTNSKTLRRGSFGDSNFDISTASELDALGWTEVESRGDYGITLLYLPGMVLQDILSTLAHELVHCKLHWNRNKNWHKHSNDFKSMANTVGAELRMNIL